MLMSAREIPLKNFSGSINQEDGYHLVNLTQTMSNSTEYNILVKAHVIDSKRCAGNETSYTYNGNVIHDDDTGSTLDCSANLNTQIYVYKEKDFFCENQLSFWKKDPLDENIC